MTSCPTFADQYRQARSWEEATRILMLAGKALPALSEDERIADNQIDGCESTVWLKLDCKEGKVAIRAHSPSKIVRGLLQLITESVQHLSLSEFEQTDFDQVLRSLNLSKYQSPSRNNGVGGVVRVLQSHQQRLAQ